MTVATDMQLDELSLTSAVGVVCAHVYGLMDMSFTDVCERPADGDRCCKHVVPCAYDAELLRCSRQR